MAKSHVARSHVETINDGAPRRGVSGVEICDVKERPADLKTQTTRQPWYRRGQSMVVLALVLLATGLSFWLSDLESEAASPFPVTPSPQFSAALLNHPVPGDEPLDLSEVQVPYPVELARGQTLSGLFADLGLSPLETHQAVASLGEHVDVRRIRAGEAGAVYFDDDRRLASLELQLRGKGRVELERAKEGWRCSWKASQRTTELHHLRGELTETLEGAIREGGGPSQLSVSMSNVLQWDLDFNRDLRLGDQFEVVYEKLFIDGEAAGVGQILALTYNNEGKLHEAYRYGDQGYYDENGRPLQKMFLRSPLPFTRVTSRFSHRRFHPVLKVHRPHYGVDFGAPTGTPVRATANGVVAFAARKGGAGKMVEVRHSQGFRTLYLHLSGYAPGVRQGRRVSQGDVIGYVGSTGLSTGPHLDYRVKKNGKYLDPMKLPSDAAEPLASSEIPRFENRRDVLRAALQGESSALQALAEDRTASPVAPLDIAQLQTGRALSTSSTHVGR